MPDLKKFINNRSAVSEVMGEVLLTTIAVLLVSFIAISISTYDGAADIPHTQVREWMDEGSDKIYLEHSGGEFLETDNLEIAVNINGERYVYNSSEIYTNLGNKSSWQLGDRIEIDTNSTWGVGIGDEDEINVFMIDIPTRQVIQYLTISQGENENSGWITITPQGTVKDTSGGDLNLMAVQKESDGMWTIYYPPASLSNNTYKEFDFDINPGLWRIWPGDSIMDTTLEIVYKVNTSSCKDVRLRVWDADPDPGTWHEENLSRYNSFTTQSVNLYTYINNTEDIANFKVRILASENADPNAEKILSVDYIALNIMKQ